jgi:tetratricopeptide (TPR) repeat protein
MGIGPDDDDVLDPPEDDMGETLGDAPLDDDEVSNALSDAPLAEDEVGSALGDDDDDAGGSLRGSAARRALGPAPVVDDEVSSALADDPLVEDEGPSAFDDAPLPRSGARRGLPPREIPDADSEFDDDFAAPEPIEDELLTSVGDVPLVEPVERRAPSDGSRGLTRALWFFGVVVTALAVLQTVQMFVARPVVERVEPAVVQRPEPPPAPAGRTPAEAIDRTLLDSRVQLSRGLYEQVRRILEPLAEDPRLLDENQRFEAYLLLAKAHRALGNVEKAQQWSLKATDQAVDRREPEQVIAEASRLADEGRHADARRILHQMLACADALPEKQADYRLKAQVRVADAWWGEAVRSGAFAPLPGLDHRVEEEKAGAKDGASAGAKR